MSQARLLQLSDRMAAVLSAAFPETGGTYTRVRFVEPVNAEKLKGRRVWIFPVTFDQVRTDGDKGGFANDYTVSVVLSEVMDSTLRVVWEDDGAEEVVADWIRERVDWLAAEVCDRFGDPRDATREVVWPAADGFGAVYPVRGPELAEIVRADLVKDKRMFLAQADFVFREV